MRVTDAEKIAELRADKEHIMALLRACSKMSDSKCRNTIIEAVHQYDVEKLKQARAALT